MQNNDTLTYDELINEINKLFEKKIKSSQRSIKYYEKMIDFRNLKISSDFLTNATSYTLPSICSIVLSASIYFGLKPFSAYDGIPFSIGLASTVIPFLINEKNNKRKEYEKYKKNRFMLNKTTTKYNNHLIKKNILIENHKKINTHQQSFNDILTQYQKNCTYPKEFVKYIFNLLEKFSLETILLNLFHNSTEYINTIDDQNKIDQINHLSSHYIETMLLDFERGKKSSRNLFVQQLQNDIWEFELQGYNPYLNQYDIHNEQNKTTYFNLLSNISTKINEEFNEIKKEINNKNIKLRIYYKLKEKIKSPKFQKYFDTKIKKYKTEFNNLTKQKTELEIKRKNLDNWPTIYSDLLSIDEKNVAINNYDKLNSIFDELLLKYDIKTLTLGFFEGKLELLNKYKSNTYEISLINNAANIVWNDFKYKKENIQNEYQQNYVFELKQLLTTQRMK